MNLEPTPLASLRPELPDALIELVEQCVAKLPADRPQSVDELATLLRESLPAAKAAGSAGTISEDASQPLSPTPRRRPPQGKPRALPVPLAAVALLAAAGAGWAVGNAGTVEPQTDRQTKATPERPPSHPGVSSPEPPAAPVSAAAALAPAATPFAPAAAAARPSGDSPELKATTLAPKTKAMGARRAPTAAPTAAGQGITPGRFDNANPYD